MSYTKKLIDNEPELLNEKTDADYDHEYEEYLYMVYYESGLTRD